MDKTDRLVVEKKQLPSVRTYSKRGDLPDNAIILTENEALNMQMKRLSKWHPRKQVWPLFYGSALSGAASALSGIFMNHHYRKKFSLLHYGRIATYAPVVVFPAALTMLLHQLLVSNEIVLGRLACSTCAAVRSGSLQAVVGGIYPMILAPISCIILARKYHTYAVPRIQYRRDVFSMLRRTSLTSGGMFFVFAGNILFGMWIADRERNTVIDYLLNPRYAADPESLDSF